MILVLLMLLLILGFGLSTLVDRHVLTPRFETRARLHAEAVQVFALIPGLAETRDHLGETGSIAQSQVSISVYDGNVSAWSFGNLKGSISNAQVQGSAELRDGYWRISNVTLTLESPPIGPQRNDMGYWGVPNAMVNFRPADPGGRLKSGETAQTSP